MFTFLFLSCGYHAEIEQEVKVNKILENTFNINTIVWIKNSMETPISIEKSYYDYDVPFSKVDSLKKYRYEQIYPDYLKVKEYIKTNHF
jgi:hypothetical protein